MKSLTFIQRLSEGLFFEPDERSYWRPDILGYHFEEASQTTIVGHPPTNLLIIEPSKEEIGTVIFTTDGSKNMSAHLPQVLWLCDLGLKVILYDIPGFGKYEGELNLEIFMELSKEAIGYASQNFSFSPFILYGKFIGSLPTLAIASQLKKAPNLVIVENCFYEFKTYLISRYGPGIGHVISSFIPGMIEPSAFLSQASLPTLVLFSDRERVQPSEYKKISQIKNSKLSFIDFSNESSTLRNPTIQSKLVNTILESVLEAQNKS